MPADLGSMKLLVPSIKACVLHVPVSSPFAGCDCKMLTLRHRLYNGNLQPQCRYHVAA